MPAAAAAYQAVRCCPPAPRYTYVSCDYTHASASATKETKGHTLVCGVVFVCMWTGRWCPCVWTYLQKRAAAHDDTEQQKGKKSLHFSPSFLSHTRTHDVTNPIRTNKVREDYNWKRHIHICIPMPDPSCHNSLHTGHLWLAIKDWRLHTTVQAEYTRYMPG